MICLDTGQHKLCSVSQELLYVGPENSCFCPGVPAARSFSGH